MLLLILSLFLAWWHGSLAGQLAQVEHQRRGKKHPGKSYGEKPLPDETEWRKLLQKKQ